MPPLCPFRCPPPVGAALAAPWVWRAVLLPWLSSVSELLSVLASCWQSWPGRQCTGGMQVIVFRIILKLVNKIFNKCEE